MVSGAKPQEGRQSHSIRSRKTENQAEMVESEAMQLAVTQAAIQAAMAADATG